MIVIFLLVPYHWTLVLIQGWNYATACQTLPRPFDLWLLLRFDDDQYVLTNNVITPGNSSGPLLNMQGQVIGMNTAIISNTGTYFAGGFAIPSNDIVPIIAELIGNGNYTHGSELQEGK
jgi:S1-C subfamily serine protease